MKTWLGYVICGLALQSSATAQWSTLSSGMDHGVRALHFDEGSGRLYAGGTFTTSGGVVTNGIAWWDGLEWHAMGIGTSPPNANHVLALDKYGDEVAICGYFDQAGTADGTEAIAVWDGENWGPPTSGGGCPGQLLCVAYLDSILYTCGTFAEIGGVPASYLSYRQDGIWHAVLDDSVLDPSWFAQVSALALYQGDVYVGGNFEIPQGLSEIARVEGGSLVQLGSGMHGDSWVRDMVVFNDLLWVSGLFYQGAGNAASMIMCWNGVQWSNPFPGVSYVSQVIDMVVSDDVLYFTGLGGPIGGPEQYMLSRFDGQELCFLGGQNVYLGALAVGDGHVYCATITDWLFGEDSIDVNFIATYDLSYPADTCIAITVGLQEPSLATAETWSVYPNPTTGPVTITGPMKALPSDLTVEVVDAAGRTCRSPALASRSGNGSLSLDLHALVPGFYVVRISAAVTGLGLAKPLVIQR